MARCGVCVCVCARARVCERLCVCMSACVYSVYVGVCKNKGLCAGIASVSVCALVHTCMYI